jgi:ribokinase
LLFAIVPLVRPPCALEVLAERWLCLSSAERIEEIRLTVGVVGSAMVDVAYRVDRLPRPSESVLARARTVDAGGKGLNQAIIAHRAGAEVRYCAGLGRDPAAAIIRARLEADGLSTAWLVSVPCATDESIVYVARSGENCIVSTDMAAKQLAPTDVEDVLMGLAPGDVLLVQGNLSREVTVVCLTRARAATATTIVNPAPIDFDYAGLWPLVDVVILNQIEARMLTGEVGIDAASAVLRSRGAGNVLLTLGSEGALVREGQEPAQRVRAPAVSVVDTTGAGDVLAGVVAAGIDRGLPLMPVVRWAVAAASHKVTRPGTSSGFPTSEELAALAHAMALP